MNPNFQKRIRHWNGNKSSIRQRYEEALLRALIKRIDPAEDSQIETDNTARRTITGEANIFKAGYDVLVTTAGNPKFKHVPKLVIPEPIDFGVLGARIAVYREDQANRFLDPSETNYRSAKIVQPADWADTPIFEANAFPLLKVENLEACFTAVHNGEADYLTLGAVEVTSLIDEFKALAPALAIDPQGVIYYPLPLQIYCHPDRGDLAEALRLGLQTFIQDGNLRRLFDVFYSDPIRALNLPDRRVTLLTNPNLNDVPDLQRYISPFLNPQSTEGP